MFLFITNIVHFYVHPLFIFFFFWIENYLLSHIFCGLKFKNSLAEWFWLRPHSQICAGSVVIYLGLGGSVSKEMHLHSWQVTQKASFPPRVSSWHGSCIPPQ